MISWTRAELKNLGRRAIERNYWKYVLTSLILWIVTGGGIRFNYNYNYRFQTPSGNSYSGRFPHFDSPREFFREIEPHFSGPFFSIFLPMLIALIILVLVTGLALRIFAFHPLECGCQRVFVMGQRAPANLGDITYPFSKSYMNVVKIQFFRYLYTFLWTLLFIVPGIIKSYEYRMIPYILAEHPDIGMEDAFALSRAMMNGDKWNAFVLDLSFLGWNILSLFTCMLLRVFYVGPYQNATNAELYSVLTWKLAPGGSGQGPVNGPSPVAPPVNPAGPVPAAGPVSPVSPADTVSATEPVSPVSSAEPVSAAEPISPVSPTEPVPAAEPVSTVSPAEPVPAAEPIIPVNSADTLSTGEQTADAGDSQDTVQEGSGTGGSQDTLESSAPEGQAPEAGSPFDFTIPAPVPPHFEAPAPEAKSLSSDELHFSTDDKDPDD
ncbi:MAG: DUF975 family protein [Lachnospiraceae bacterium]|nr:DUF975 family protein [Lachnospiraceae bacterium]